MVTADDLKRYGIITEKQIVYNPSYEELFKAEMDTSLNGFEKGVLTDTGAVAVKTGVFTGRSPKDKYFVKDAVTADTIWWECDVNKPITQEVWSDLKGLVVRRLSEDQIYVVDVFCGTNPDTRMKVRFIMEVAWQAHFVTNMFIRPSLYEQDHFGEPDFVVLNGSKVTNPK